jgi:hypothetical protein
MEAEVTSCRVRCIQCIAGARLISFWPTILLAGLTLGVLGTTPAEAASVLSQSVYMCDEFSGCAASSDPPIEVPGPNSIDPSATAGDTDTVPLTPTASVNGVVLTSGLHVSASARGVPAPPPGSPPSPPVFRLAAIDSDLSANARLVASLYWEDDITVSTGLGGPAMLFKPTMRFSGDLDLFTDPGLGGAGVVEWFFAMSLDDDTFWTQGGDCIDFSSSGSVNCAPNSGFGTFSPLRDVFIGDGIPFNLKAGIVVTLAGTGMTGFADLGSTIEWLGMDLFDASGAPVPDFSVNSASGIDWSLASVPEPGTASLVGLGLSLAAVFRRVLSS